MVIGARGFIGSELVRRLTRFGHQVTALSSRDPRGIDPDTGLLPSDFVIPAGTDAVYFVAASPLGRDSAAYPAHLFAVNVVAAVQAARAAVRAGVQRFLYASTGNVYAPGFRPLREIDPVRRDDWYALSKVQAEEALALLQPLLQVTACRLFGVYGAGQKGRLLPNLAESIRKGAPVRLEGNPADPADRGGLRISLCHVADAAEALIELAASDTAPFVVNIAGDDALSIRQIAESIGEAAARTPNLEQVPEQRSGDLVSDNSRLRTLTKVRFRPFKEGVRDVLLPADQA